MRKNVFGKKFSRDTTSRRAMYRALLRSFILNHKLVTTHAKAKVLIPMVENLLNQGKQDSLAVRRHIYAFTGNDRMVSDEIVKISKNTKGSGRSMIKHVNLSARKGDNAPMVRIEFVEKIDIGKIISADIGEKKIAVSKKKKREIEKKTESVKKKPTPLSVIRKFSLKNRTDNK
ncbi:MAG: 50S ribosomal protein L17 [Candidatus Woesebacteria bacterium GW2011_GWD1_38_10]|uniref:50S ribosomal protein L17 n=2 Tax=Candidatus Woeseibacteriota TaxID=1752722 RepID=A0A0G0KZ78_9BACT|nr:MAG: 50S ribosomal protein L17 [Candidatus Woesebacteria bacterium GW2011_GWD1_38_10]KKQ84047.1 MAG: 50S ribosomal protein L17 [Candidatus Woesebacteria bacterium GW2011_GWA1_38_8]